MNQKHTHMATSYGSIKTRECEDGGHDSNNASLSVPVFLSSQEEEIDRICDRKQSWCKKSLAALFVTTFIAFAAVPYFLRVHNSNVRSTFRTTELDAEEIVRDTSTFSRSRAKAPPLAIGRPEQIALMIDHQSSPPPFSTLDPVADLNINAFDNRPFAPGEVFSELSKGFKSTGFALPTNKWYENMVLVPDKIDPTGDNQVYTVPYVLNTIGPVPGIKIHATRLLANDKIVQVTFNDGHGLTLGGAHSLSTESLNDKNDKGVKKRYGVDYVEGEHLEGSPGAKGPLTALGLTLRWEATNDDEAFNKMTSSIVRGMPYGTMHYHYNESIAESKDGFGVTLPTVVAELHLAKPPVTDTGDKISCTKGSSEGKEALVGGSVEFTFIESDFTWLVFYSQPVYVRCYEIQGRTPFVLQATRLADGEEAHHENDEVIFTSRVALMNNCTYGRNPSYCSKNEARDGSGWSTLLKKHANVYPGKNTKIDYTFFSEKKHHKGDYSYMQFDWDARRMKDRLPADPDEEQLLMYSLPHHREILHPQTISENAMTFGGDMYCAPSLNGQACAVSGSTWVLREDLDGQPSFWAPRPPSASSLPLLAQALKQDINFTVPSYFAKGAGDTYFSGKILAKLARILLIDEELNGICAHPKKFGSDYVHACKKLTLPSEDEFNKALDHLRSSTEVWINGTAVTPFIFDGTWGGLVSCGCWFDEKTMSCSNAYPDCPAFGDAGLNFGNAFYNDHHFHYGYHIYAAAAVAHFDEDWGKKNFENVLLLIRDFANPSPDDKYFPMYRMKDFYLGNSWASGIAMGYPNGRNQESSSEAIAAYEAVALFGSVMAHNWGKDADVASPAKATRARHIRDVGRLLTATEVRSADRYWHVRQRGPKSGIYPKQYSQYGVGIMWNMMAQFQTWFGAAPHLAYGIQLLPLTPVSERRDDVDWVKQLYPSLAESCRNDPACDAEGWGVLQNAMLATVGHPHDAVKYAATLPEEAYESAGGNGHSRTNTIWYYASRPKVKPLKLGPVPSPTPPPQEHEEEIEAQNLDCGCPDTCTTDVLHINAGGHTCGDRIRWLMDTSALSEYDACSQVGGGEFTGFCAGCDPGRCVSPQVSPAEIDDTCPPCPLEICRDPHKNRCPVFEAPFLCLEGGAESGCSAVPWTGNCNKCCQLTYKCL